MRPTTIPDTEIWAGAQRIVMAPPDGDLTNDHTRPLEMLAEVHNGQHVYSARLILEPGDLDTIQAGGNIWLSFYGAVALARWLTYGAIAFYAGYLTAVLIGLAIRPQP